MLSRQRERQRSECYEAPFVIRITPFKLICDLSGKKALKLARTSYRTIILFKTGRKGLKLHCPCCEIALNRARCFSPAELGEMIEITVSVGLHHSYERRAA